MKKLFLFKLMIGALLCSPNVRACTCAIRDLSLHEQGAENIPLNPVFHYEPVHEAGVLGRNKASAMKPEELKAILEKRRLDITSAWETVTRYQVAFFSLNNRTPGSFEDEANGDKVSLKEYARITVEHIHNDEPLMVITSAHPLHPGTKYELLLRASAVERWQSLGEFTTMAKEDRQPPRFAKPTKVNWLNSINDCWNPEGPFLQVDASGVTDDVAEGHYWFDLWFADEHGKLVLDRPADLGLPSRDGNFIVGHGYCLQPVYDFHEKLDKFKFGIRVTDQAGHSSAVQIIEAPFPTPEAVNKKNPIVTPGK